MKKLNVNQEQRQFQKKHFIEEVGLLLEQMGLPRMAGRIFGWLLICSPPQQSTGELADILQASKGSISTMTRLLIQIGLIERISLPGQRRDHFQIKTNAWFELTKQRLTQMTALRQLSERGLTIIEDEDIELQQRLGEMRDMYALFERELAVLIQRCEQQRKKPEKFIVQESRHPSNGQQNQLLLSDQVLNPTESENLLTTSQ